MYTLFYNVRLNNQDLRTKLVYFQTKEKLLEFLDKEKAKYIVSSVVAYDIDHNKMEIA